MALTADRHRVVVVGGGFGGLSVTRALAGADAEVTLVDRANHHLFQPLLYQVATGILPPGLIAPTLRHVLRAQPNAQVLLAEAGDVDLDRRLVRIMKPDGRLADLRYDSLVLATGATHSYFRRAEFASFAPGMKTIEDARYLRDEILSSFEMAELATDPRERAEWLTFVVVGAGPTGVELAGQVAELAHTVLPRSFRDADTSEARIVLLEGAASVLPTFGPRLQRYAQRQLEKMGVEIRLNTLAVDMDHESVTVQGESGGETIRARTRIWAAGVRASPLAALLAGKLGVQADRAGRLPVGPDCTLAGHPEVFAIGDMVSLNGGSMATIGHRRAVVEAGSAKFTGTVAYLLWGLVHLVYLIGWSNRIGTLYSWACALYPSRNRNHRLISFHAAEGEVAGQRTLSRAIRPHSASAPTGRSDGR